MVRVIMFAVWCFAGLLLIFPGCRVSITAEKLETTVAIDAPEYLSREDPALYYDSDSKSDERSDERTQ